MHPKINQMLNWRLLPGSHEFPGEDGGTCINEAAIVSAGFPYRKVGSTNDLPECFSRALGGYLLTLNDMLNHRDRQQLMAFVHRLAGSRGSPDEEEARMAILDGRLMELENLIKTMVSDINERLEVWMVTSNKFLPEYEYLSMKYSGFEISRHIQNMDVRTRLQWMLRYAYETGHRVVERHFTPDISVISNFDAMSAADTMMSHRNLSDIMVEHFIHTAKLMFVAGPSTAEADVDLIKTRMNTIKEEARERAKSKVSENA
jgi:hypothetical protein